jgi:hypothetical protein
MPEKKREEQIKCASLSSRRLPDAVLMKTEHEWIPTLLFRFENSQTLVIVLRKMYKVELRRCVIWYA